MAVTDRQKLNFALSKINEVNRLIAPLRVDIKTLVVSADGIVTIAASDSATTGVWVPAPLEVGSVKSYDEAQVKAILTAAFPEDLFSSKVGTQVT